MLMYCKKCGRIIDYNRKSDCKCDCCGSDIYKVPAEFLIEPDFPGIKKELKQQFIEEYIKASPEFDQELFEQKASIRHKRYVEYEKMRDFSEQKLYNVPRCPTCGSTNISKIGTLGRALSVSFFGLASNKIGKTHKCNNCGTTW